MSPTPQYNHSDEAKKEYSRIFYLLLNHKDKNITAGKVQNASNGDTYVEIFFKEPLSNAGTIITSLFLELPTLNVYRRLSEGNLAPWLREDGGQHQLRDILKIMRNKANRWVSASFLELINDFFSCEQALEFSLRADAAFEQAAASAHSRKPCRSSFFGITTAKLEAALNATGGAVTIDLTAPILKGNKEALVEALIAVRDGGSPRWPSDHVFYLLETKRPIILRQIPGSPMRPSALQPSLLLVSSKAPQQLFVCDYKLDATSEETDETELFLNCIIPAKGEEHKNPFRLAELRLSTVSDGTSTGLTLSGLFRSLVEEGRLTESQKRTISQSKVIREDKPQDPPPKRNGLPEYETEIVQVPNTPAINTMIDILNKPRNIDEGRYVRKEAADPITNPGATNLIYEGKDDLILWEVPDWDRLFPQAIPNGPKVFDVMMREVQKKSGAETITIPLSYFAENGIYSDLDTAYEGVKGICEKLFQVEVSGESMVYAGKEKKRKPFVKSRVISQYGIQNSELKVSFAPIYRQSAPYLTVMPDWAFRLTNTAYVLTRYLMEVARQRTDKIKETGRFRIAIDAVRIKLGLPAPDDVPKKLKEKIREPIERAIDTLNAEQQLHDGEWMLKISQDWLQQPKTTREWLRGELIVEVSPKIAEHMTSIQQAKQKAISRGKKKAPKALPQ